MRGDGLRQEYGPPGTAAKLKTKRHYQLGVVAHSFTLCILEVEADRVLG